MPARGTAAWPDEVALPDPSGDTETMGIRVIKGHFDGLPAALEDIARDGYWPTTFISEPSPPPAVPVRPSASIWSN